MKPQKGYYSVVQYCPDLSRVEAANIGVLLFCPDSGFLKAMTTSNNRRIIQFFGRKGHDWKRINAVKKALQDRLEKEQHDIRTVDNLRQFIATRANVLQFTPPRPMKVLNADRELAVLYKQILGPTVTTALHKDFRRLVGDMLSVAGLEQKIVADVKVKVPVLGKELAIPYGFQNGRFNLINPVSFKASDSGHSFRTACKYAVEGRSIYEHPDDDWGQLQLVVVGQFRRKDDESRSLVQRVFDENHVKLYSAEELPKLIDEIRLTAKEIDRSQRR